MKEKIVFLIISCILFSFDTFAQGQITRPQKPMSINKTLISEPDGYFNGRGYVDLGLPSKTKWAIHNLGATSPFEEGDLFCWGYLFPKKYSRDEVCNTYGKFEDISGNPQYDAATAIW